MISGPGLDLLRDTGDFPCAVCRSGVGSNSIECSQCRHWVHKKCSGIRGRISANPQYLCPRCLDQARPIDGRPVTEVDLDGTMLDVEPNFCYLGDMLCSGGGCKLTITTRCCTAWGKFKELLPILLSRHTSFTSRGKVFNACVRSALLHGSESWAPTASDLQRLRRNDRAMVRWICGVRLNDEVPTVSLYNKLGIQEVSDALRSKRLRWYGHATRATSCTNGTMNMTLPSTRGRGRPRKSWSDCIQTDLKECRLGNTSPHDRGAWRSGVRRSSRLLPTPVSGTPAAEDKSNQD